MFGLKRKEEKKCTVTSMENDLLAEGIVVEESAGSVVIESSERMPKILINTIVKLIIRMNSNKIETWVGRVYQSTPERLRIDGLVSYNDFERRQLFRVSINAPAKLLIYERSFGAERKIAEIEAFVKDMSPGGMLIAVPKGTVLRPGSLKIRFNFFGEIREIRVALRNIRQATDTQRFYGVVFQDLVARDERVINAYLLQVQQEQIRRSKTRPNPHTRW